MHSLAITEQGVAIHIEGDQLLLQKNKAVLRRVRLGEIEQLVLLGQVELTSAAIAALARQGVDVVFLSRHGYFRARLLSAASKNVQLRLAQFQRCLDAAFASRIAQAVLLGKITHQRQLLLRGQRKLRDDALAQALGQLWIILEQLRATTNLETLRGLEGRAAAIYFAHLPKLVQPPEFTFLGRSRRPPRDPFNACLSFGYTLLGRIIESELLRAGLDPMLGFLHQPHYGRPSLMLDLLEELRPLIDSLVLRLVNRRQLGPLDFERHQGQDLAEILADPPSDELDADPAPEGVYLADTGRRVFLTEFFRRLRERLFYPPRQASLEWRDIIREQVYHLARVIDGKDDAYRPFVPA
ncbi:MAG: CRISPR-associated endonuclease Cas1 [Gemmataceae bacterium]|nr:CRISPR-associated endonuclease Cas1 [Gemmataceae bacterium]MDW8265893.1 CRISPR-associated endonuclease Cas1 [Gemmataceae bacterium]